MKTIPELPSTVTSISLVAMDIARSIVQHPHHVSVDVFVSDDAHVVLLLSLHPDDLEEVAAQQGRVLRAFHTVIHAVAARNNLNIKLQIESQRPTFCSTSQSALKPSSTQEQL